MNQHFVIPAVLAFFLSLGLLAGREETSAAADTNLCIEALIVRLPRNDALRRIPELRNPARVHAAVSDLKSLVQSGNAILIASPVEWCVSGEKTVVSTIHEIPFATEYVPPEIEGGFGNRSKRSAEGLSRAVATGLSGIPTAFERRNAGVEMQVEPTVLRNGSDIAVEIEARHTEFTGMASVYKRPSLEFAQPGFRTLHVTQSMQVRSGSWNVLGTAIVSDDVPKIELFLLRLTAMP